MLALHLWLAEYAAMRREVLVMVMRKHQRYFPVYTEDEEELLPYFVTVANGAIHPPTVISGMDQLTVCQTHRPSDGTFRKLGNPSFCIFAISLLSLRERQKSEEHLLH
jgi:hypothetical protein